MVGKGKNWPFLKIKIRKVLEFRFYEPPMNSSFKKKREVKIKILSQIRKQIV
jgi:hypothetical protein